VRSIQPNPTLGLFKVLTPAVFRASGSGDQVAHDVVNGHRVDAFIIRSNEFSGRLGETGAHFCEGSGGTASKCRNLIQTITVDVAPVI
jgi:hypothetical protein